MSSGNPLKDAGLIAVAILAAVVLALIAVSYAAGSL